MGLKRLEGCPYKMVNKAFICLDTISALDRTSWNDRRTDSTKQHHAMKMNENQLTPKVPAESPWGTLQFCLHPCSWRRWAACTSPRTLTPSPYLDIRPRIFPPQSPGRIDASVVMLYPWVIKTGLSILPHNFGKYWPIINIFFTVGFVSNWLTKLVKSPN